MLMAIVMLIALTYAALILAFRTFPIRMAGITRMARPIPENLVITDFADLTDGLAAVWNDNATYQVPDGNLLAFKTRRLYRYAFAMVLSDDAVPTAMPDATEVRLIVRYPDNLTFKSTIWIGTYGTITNATKYDIDTMITATQDIDVQPNEYIILQTRHATATLDISESTVDLGATRWTNS